MPTSTNSYILNHYTRNISEQLNDTTDLLILDSGGGKNCTITKRAFHINEIISGQKIALSGYQDKKDPKICSIVNGVTKAFVKGRNEPVLFHINNATLLDDEEELESLCVPFNLMKHGIKCDLTPTIYGGKGGMTIGDEFFPFDFDEEKLFFKIVKPNSQDMNDLEHYELTSLLKQIHTRIIEENSS